MTGGFYFGAVLDSITRVAADLGHSVIALQTLAAGLDSGEEHAPAFLRLPVAQHQVGGYICVTNSLPHDDLAQITAAGKPLVLISAEPEGLAVPVTLPDNAGGVAAAVEHLVGHGHRRIGFVGHLWLTDVRERYAAYTAAMLMHGITPEASWLFEASDNLEEGGAHAARLMISESIPTTAVIVATDRNAAGLIRALRTAGMDLPDDQAIVGFDNAELGLRLSPSLTTVDQHIDRMAALAAQLVLSQMRG